MYIWIDSSEPRMKMNIRTAYESIQVQIREFCETIQFTKETIQVWIDSSGCESIHLKTEI